MDPHGLLAVIDLSLGHVLGVARHINRAKYSRPSRSVGRRWDIVRTNESCLDRAESGKALAGCMGSLALLRGEPRLPVLKPGLVIVALVQIDVELPVTSSKPLGLQSVQLGNSDATNLRPRPILERVIVEEFAAQQQRNREQSPNLALASLERAVSLAGIDALCKVIQPEQDRRAGETRRGEDLRDELPEGRRNCSIGRHHSHGHLRHVFRHGVDLVVEDSTHTAGHDDGSLWWY